jgi:hypothetical protein
VLFSSRPSICITDLEDGACSTAEAQAHSLSFDAQVCEQGEASDSSFEGGKGDLGETFLRMTYEHSGFSPCTSPSCAHKVANLGAKK